MNKFLAKLKGKALNVPVAILIGSLVFSIAYIQLNKYAYLPNTPVQGSVTIINNITGKYCVVALTDKSMDHLLSDDFILPICDDAGVNSDEESMHP